MSRNDDDRFRVHPGAPKQRGDAFVTQVLRQASKAGEKAGKAGNRPGARLGRGALCRSRAGTQCPARDHQDPAGQSRQGREALDRYTSALHRARRRWAQR